VIAVPEIVASINGSALPFTTISKMVGHIEYVWSPAALIVIAAIVFAVYSLLKHPAPSVVPPAPAPGPPTRTPAGRLSRESVAPLDPPAVFDAAPVPWQFVVAALGAVAVVIAATVLTIELWDDPRHFRPSYVLYGLLTLFWLEIPSLVAFFAGKDAPFPTLFRTVQNLEDGLRPRWPWLAWLVSFAIVAVLTIELLHITLYPFPDITHILNRNG
jgi:hypothetical protein